MPMTYKTKTLEMDADGYNFIDIVRVGAPLTALMWASLSTILAVSYGL